VRGGRDSPRVRVAPESRPRAGGPVARGRGRSHRGVPGGGAGGPALPAGGCIRVHDEGAAVIEIRAVELRLVSLPLRRPFRTSFGEEATKEAILVRVEPPDGPPGWGECAA